MALEAWQARPEDQIDMRSPQLTGKEGCRVEVTDLHGETRRFWVGRNHRLAKIQIHLEIRRRNSSGGHQADREYASVRIVDFGPR